MLRQVDQWSDLIYCTFLCTCKNIVWISLIDVILWRREQNLAENPGSLQFLIHTTWLEVLDKMEIVTLHSFKPHPVINIGTQWRSKGRGRWWRRKCCNYQHPIWCNFPLDTYHPKLTIPVVLILYLLCLFPFCYTLFYSASSEPVPFFSCIISQQTLVVRLIAVAT